MIRLGAHFKSKPQRASLRFPLGMSDVVAGEVTEILANPYTPHAFTPLVQSGSRRVTLKNISLRSLGELCLRLTTAKDVIWHLGDLKVVYESELVEAVRRIPWQAILHDGGKVALRASTTNSRIYHSGLMADCAAKALASVGIDAAEKGRGITTLELTLRANQLSLGLSMAGSPLNHRGYREGLSHQAPLNECLAASVLQFAEAAVRKIAPELRGAVSQVHVPFAGSGTFGFEALLRFGRIAPCVFRENYAAEHFDCLPDTLFKHTREKSRRLAACKQVQIRFLEIDHELCELLKRYSNGLLARLSGLGLEQPLMEVEEGDFFSMGKTPSGDPSICLLLNPPYGERLHVDRDFFSALGEKIIEVYGGGRMVWGAALVPSGAPAAAFNAAMGKSVAGMKAVRNGGISVNAIAFLMR